MDDLSAIRSFVEIAEQGSLTRAADALGLPRAMVSRHLGGLERRLGKRLLHRTTSRVGLNEAGQEALPRLRQMLELAFDVQAVAGARRTERVGKRRGKRTDRCRSPQAVRPVTAGAPCCVRNAAPRTVG